MNFQLDAFFKSPYLFEVGVYFRHMHLWRDPHMRESPGSLTPSVFLRHPVKPYKKKIKISKVLKVLSLYSSSEKKTKTEKSPHTKTLVSPQPIGLCRNNGRKSRSDFYLQKALSLGLKRVRKKQS